MSNPIIDFIELSDSGSLTANRTYVIREDHTVTSSSATIPENVTLYFWGGILLPHSAGIALTGNHTRIIAPAVQIFAADLTVNGTWEIDRAYPQWFGAKTYASVNSSSIDSAPAINKAITMKRTGEVFLPRGHYRVNSSIEVTNGIKLTGEPGFAYSSDILTQGTVLTAGASSISSISMTKNSEGLFFHLAYATACGNQTLMRVYRGTSTNYTQYVDIPITGTTYLYDNGISVCGFKWENIGSEYLTSLNTNITSICYKGKNIECYASSPPSLGTWQDGDITFNTGTGTTTAHWIYLSGAWRPNHDFFLKS
jgi:hypothetical protein